MKHHDFLTDNHGPAAANGAMRTLRAIYNHAAKSDLDLPPASPTRAVDWNPMRRRNTAMGRKDLNGWFNELIALQNPIRREFHLFSLLSGSRPTVLKTARPEHINFRERLLHIPCPKGGTDRAFDIPLSRAMLRCLFRAMKYGRAMYPEQSRNWIFTASTLPSLSVTTSTSSFNSFAMARKRLNASARTEMTSTPASMGILPCFFLKAACTISSSEGPSTRIERCARISRNVSWPGSFRK